MCLSLGVVAGVGSMAVVAPLALSEEVVLEVVLALAVVVVLVLAVACSPL